ncbi:hypothetical protein EXIGLDRAFT_763640 [Exidia glandulosa HHB12029]|uniref:Uncharacterized protein n=1 Tax=Exidia glandulosa HHB12029 TaxID=1314781 RepID=A0A165LUF0_EXIGL|nr:hypothetical protein EXIGLDRAFT_763640 [Exidia glandulosa HHB12029]
MSLSYSVSLLAQEHARLLQQLAQLEYAPSSLASANNHLKDVKSLVSDAEQKFKTAKKAEDKEGGEAYSAKHSVFRKFSYRAVGKAASWDAKATKEEREWLEAYEKRVKAEDSLKAAQRKLLEAEQNVFRLGAEVGRRDVLLHNERQMYSRVFDGPTPEAPQDDQLEWAVRRCEDEHNVQQAALNLEIQTLSSLADAKNTLAMCMQKMQECESASTYDIFGGGVGADMMENNALSSAQMYSHQFKTAFAQAKRLNPAVGSISNVHLPQASMTDVVFDNFFTDIAQHEKINAGLNSVRTTRGQVDREINRAKERVDAVARKVKTAADALARSRTDLFEFRKRTFVALAAPPRYAQETGPARSSNEAPPSFPAGPSSAGPSFPQGPEPGKGVAPPQAGYALPAPAPYSILSDGPPSFPAGPPSSPTPEGVPPVHWANINPYAAQLVRKSSLEMEGKNAK